jgi:chitin synthase
MAGNNRMSTYSNVSSALAGPRIVNSAAQQSQQVSTTTLLNAIHTIYTTGRPYKLDASTSLAVNTWLTATQTDQNGRTGGTVDRDLGTRAWEHARRRAEDGCIVLGCVFSML